MKKRAIPWLYLQTNFNSPIMQEDKKISEVLNLIGYGLAKFDVGFIREFNCQTKSAFYGYIVELGLAKTIKAVSNRQDSFDPYFDNGRKGWWQRSQRKHIKIFIDSLFGKEDSKTFAETVKAYMKNLNPNFDLKIKEISPVTISKFKQLQSTGHEAEYYFMENYRSIGQFEKGIIEDARLWGDGYDFQIKVSTNFLLSEVKGLQNNSGGIRVTENEYKKASEYLDRYFLVVVSNLSNIPKMTAISNPIQELDFQIRRTVSSQKNYHTKSLKW